MSNTLYVASRKGMFSFTRNGGGHWKIERVSFLAEPVSMVLRDSRDNYLYAALNLGHFGVKLHRSKDGGANWEECAVPVYPEGAETKSHTVEGNKKASLTLIWALEPGGKDEPGLLWAGTIPGGLFRSRDNGSSWELIHSLWDRPERINWFGGGYPEPGIHSVCVNPRDSKHITLGISSAGVWTTQDGGETWELRGKGLRAEYMPPEQAYDPGSQDAHRLVQCAADPNGMWVQHHNGIFRSTDAGHTFEEFKEVQPAVFGFAVAVHPQNPDVAWFVPGVKDQTRIPVDGKLVVTRTKDGGKTFEALRNGLPQEHAYDLVYRHGLDVDETGDRLVMGSTTGNLWITENQGDNWECLSTHLPPIYAVRFA